MTAAEARPWHRPGWGTRRVLERNLVVARRQVQIIVSGLFDPLFYLLSIGIGVGALVGDVETAAGPVPYVRFVAPAMMATSAMNGAVAESTFNLFFRMKYEKLYDTMLATPLTTADIARGEILYSQLRGLLYGAAFLVAMVVIAGVRSPWAVLCLPAAMLVGFCFAALGMAFTTYLESWQDFDLIALVTLPLFLFSTTFFPAEVYPEWGRWVLWLSPLYHGVELVRGFALGQVGWVLLAHAGVLVALTAAGSLVVGRRLRRLLLT